MQRSLTLLRKRGYYCEIVEFWKPWSKTRKDLWGWCDILCLGPLHILAVQTTSLSNIGARVKKIRASQSFPLVRNCMIMVVVHGWQKRGGKWEVREVGVS
jgi:hypothetical protein